MKTYPLLQSQLGLFMECIKYPSSTQYNLPTCSRIDDSVDLDRMEEALHNIISSRASFKNRFALNENGDPVQWYDADMEIPVVRRQCSRQELDDYCKKGFVRPFDLLKGEPLVRMEIVSTEEGSFFLCDFSHTIMDGLSYSRLLNEDIDKVYQGKCEGFDDAMYQLAEEDQYLFDTEEYARARKYNIEKFTDKEFITISNGDGQTLAKMLLASANIEKDLCDNWCKENKVRIDLLFQAAFCHVIGVLTRQSSIVYGTAYHGRGTRARLRASGMFVNTVAVLADVSAERRVRDLISDLEQELTQAFDHAVYPIRQMYKDIQQFPKIIFNFRGSKRLMPVLKVGGISYETDELVRGRIQDDMDISIILTGDDYKIRIESSEAMNSQQQIQMVADALRDTVANIINHPDITLGDLAVISEEKQNKLLALGKGEELVYDQQKTWLDMFLEQAAAHPEKTAVADQSGSYTYGELAAAADKIALCLAQAGVGETDHVAIRLGRTKNFVAAVIAIHKLGAAYIPIDEDYPEERVSYIIDNSEAKLIIDEMAVKNALAGDTVIESVPVNAKPDMLAYMIYTSGTTGNPKGVMIPHRGMMNFVNFIRVRWGLSQDSRIACHSNFAFDASVEDLYPVLTAGGTLYIVPDEERKDLILMKEYIKANGITGGCYTTQFGQLLGADESLDVDYICLGGEKMTSVPKTRGRVFNTYGPTEFTVDATYFELEPGQAYEDIPIGRPLANCSALILDKNGRLLPQGAVGELCLAGPQLAMGYWKLPEKTAEVFQTVCLADKQVNIYRTGDLCRYNDKGMLEYVGRMDFQVKLRGFRIEMGEVENRAASYPGIRNLNAQVRTLNGVQHLCLYYTANMQISQTALKEYLAQGLPEFMIPTAYMQLEEMPLTANGKVDRKALPEPVLSADEIVAPETELEQKVADLVAEVLGLPGDSFGVTNNLISLGLDSLRAMALAVKISRQLQYQIRVVDIIQRMTIRRIAEFLTSDNRTGRKLTHYETRDYYPLTENQRGVYIAWEMNPETTQYNIPSVYKLDHKDIDKLVSAIQHAANVHNYIKTRFAKLDNDVVQLPNPGAPVEIPVSELQQEPDPLFFQSRIRPFDLLNDPLYRIELYKYQETVYLFMDIHHMVIDGLSVSVLMSDILDSYYGKELQPEEITAYDVALYEKELSDGSEFKEAESYFDTLAAGAEAASYPDSDTANGKPVGYAQIAIPAADIDAFCSRNSLTANSYFQTVMSEVLISISNTDKPLYLTISNGRSLGNQLDRTVGMFVKTLPVVVQEESSRASKVADFCQAVQEQLQKTYAFDYYPYTRFVEKHALQGQIMFSYQGGIEEESSEYESLPVALDTAKFPILLSVYPKNGQYIIHAEYDGLRYNSKAVHNLLQIMGQTAGSMAQAEERKDICLVSEQEREALLGLGTGPVLERDQSETILDIFKDRVSKTPEAAALVFHDRSYTYGELDAITDKLAVYLHKNYGITAEENVGILIERSELMLILPLAVMKNGAAYMPLDPHFPTERLAFMCEDAEVKLILSEGNLMEEKLPDYAGSSFNCQDLSGLPQITAQEVAELKGPAAHNRMVILFTSGSTGKPKAVELEHYGIVNFCHWYVQEFGLTMSDRVAGYANFGFDAHMIDLYPSILGGSAVYIFDEDMRMDIPSMNAYMEENKISVAFMTTQVGCIIREINHSLRYLSTGGEKMPPVTPPDFRFLNVYGPTECTIISTYYDVHGYFEGKYIGKPLPNYQLYVVDKDQRLLPEGMAGELLIAGQGVARGYLKRPELTAEKFILFQPTPDSEPVRAYRSGDLVRWSNTGDIEFLGRLDNQVKLRGLRIELGEIENRAASFAGIRQVAVDVKKDQLCCYYVAEAAINKEELKAHLAETLTDFMVPEVYIQLERMPLNPNGKVDRKQLPEPEIQLTEIVPPANEREQQLFDILAELLQHDGFGVTSNLLSIGMSSLMAMRFSARLGSQGISLKVAEIMKRPSIRELAAYLDAGTDEAQTVIQHFEDIDCYPITENQRGIYIDWEMNQETTQYNIPAVYKFTDKQPDKLVKAVETAIDNHSVLKTKFALMGEDVMQIPRPEDKVTVLTEKLAKEPKEDFFQQRVKAFDLFNDRLYRAEIYSWENVTYLFLDIHHIVFDGLSTSVLLKDVLKAYDGSALKPEAVTTYDFALYERELLSGAAYGKAEEYFHDLVAGAEAASYPASKNADGTANGAVQITVSGQVIGAAARVMGVTEASYFQAAFGETLHRILRENKFMYLTISNGREADARLGDCVGMFVKTLPVVFDRTQQKEAAVSEVVREYHTQLQTTIENDFFPYTKLVEDCRIKGEILFVFQGDVIEEDMLTQTETVPLELDTAKLPITITVFPRGENYLINVEYDGMCYSKSDMQNLAQALVNVAENMAEAQSVQNISLAGADELGELLALGKGPEMERDEDETVLDLFKARTAKTPEADAVVFHDRHYTYQELDQLTDKLAVYFRTHYGFGREDNVGVLINRSELMLVYPLAIMKTGAAYMPLDPHFPTERLAFMCEDAKVQVILSEDDLVNEKLPDFAGDSFNSSQLTYLPEVTAEETAKLQGPTAHNRLVILFTSGSTGKPKAVELEHYGIVNFCHWYVQEFGLTMSDRVAGYANFGFDAHMIDLYPSILGGSAVYIFDEDMRMDIPSMNAYMEENKISVAFMTTQVGCIIREINHSLRYLSTGGEKMPPVTPPDFRFLNVYGPTECSLFSTYYDVHGYFEGEYIGKPLPNYQLYIIDQYMQPITKGMAGELLIAGHGVARGYMNRPELNEEKFILFKPTPDSEPVRAYRSGDLVRWSDSGELEFLGRIDKQVKLRGLRIELGEIENRIAQYPGIRQVAVDVKQERLCCYYVASQEVDKEALKGFLRENLAEFMIPEIYMKMDALPLNPNGKIDRKALPEPAMTSSAAYVEPVSMEEKALAAAMEKVLGLKEPVGALDNFFELGGDSIKAIRIISMLRQQDINLKVADIMKQKVVRKIAQEISGSTVMISQEPYEGQVADSAIVSFFKNLELPVPHYFNQSTQLKLRERGQKDLLQQAINSLTYQHDMLRAVVKDGKLWIREASVIIPVEEYTIEDMAESLSVCRELQTNINMAEALMRVAFIHGPEADYLFIVVHHLIVDGVSWRIITEDLEQAYQQLLSGQSVSLPRKTHTYHDYVEAMQKYRNSYVLSLEKPYWETVQARLLAGATSQEKDYSREFATINLLMDPETTNKCIRGNFAIINGDINDALITAVCRSYRKVTGENTVSVQFEGHGRENIGAELVTDRTVGWFTSIYPIVIDGLKDELHGNLLQVKETMHRLPNKGVGYNILKFMQGEKENSLAGERIAKIGFNYLGEMDAEQDEESFFFSTAELNTGADFDEKNCFGTDISINCAVEQGQLGMSFAYNKAVLTEAQSKDMAEGIFSEMQAIAEHLSDCQTQEITASDLGENEWTMEEFHAVVADFEQRNEKLQRIYPLSTLQEGMLYKHVSEPDSWAYRLVTVFEMDKLPSEDQLTRVLERLGQKHEVLRTAIIHKQVIQPRQAIVDRKLSLTMMDYTQEPDPQAAVRAYREEVMTSSYDLQEKPLFGLTCIKLSENSCYLVVMTHHIIVDGWCLGIYTNDLLQFIHEELTGEFTKDTPPEAGVYESAVREILQKDKQTGLKYWHDLLEGYEDLAQVPSFGTVPEEERSEVNEIQNFVSADTMEKLGRLCQEEQTTLNCGIEMVLGLLLQTYKRSNDVVFGKVVSGRDNTEKDINNLVGLFINTIPVRMKCENTTTVRQLLQSMQAQSTASNTYDFCPLEEIQNQSDLGNNLFQFVFAFENYDSGLHEEEQQYCFNAKPCIVKEENFENFSITCYLMDDGRLCIHISFAPELYRLEDMETVFKLFNTLLEAAVENPEQPVSGLPRVSNAELQQVMELSAGEKMDYDQSETWLSALKRQVICHGTDIAIVDEVSSITYAELDNQSDKLAAYLSGQGVKEGCFVAIKMGRVKEFVTAVIALHKIGAAYIPLDEEYPEERIRYVMEDSEAFMLITEDVVNAALNSDLQTEIIQVKATPDHLAYMIYTSGSTGKPKGVIIQHRAMMNFLSFICERWQLTDKSRIACHSNFAFDASVEDLYPVLMTGGTMFIVPEAERKDISLMSEYLIRNGITGGCYTTQFGQLLCAEQELALDYICVGGEKMTSVPRVTGHVYNTYGPTEFTVDATYFELDKNAEYTNIPIGRPVYNCYAFILDKQGNLLPPGLVGELCLAGPQMSKGYWKLPEKTAEVFKTVELAGQKVKIYRTGDLARYNHQGYLEYYGRIDFQVKLRGFRIELGEVESRAMEYPDCRMVSAQVKHDQLVLYYTADRKIDKEKLQDFLSRTLTSYMLPTVYMQLDEMPLTANGKVDRRLLPEPEISTGLEIVKPATYQEAQYLRIAKDMLPGVNFGVTDDLMNLGMSSLTAMKYAAALRAVNQNVRVADIMRYRSIREIIKGNMRMFWFYEAFDENKPVLVFAQGIVNINATMPMFAKWSKYFNIMVIEPVDEHYHIVFEGECFDEIIEFYSLLITRNVPLNARIFAFMGFSFGGEIAAYLAERWNEDTGEKPAVILGDTFFNIHDRHVVGALQAAVDSNIIEIKENAVMSVEEQMYKNEVMSQIDTYPHTEFKGYDGKVIYLKACVQQAGMPDGIAQANDEILNKKFSDLEIVRYENLTHEDLFIRNDLIPDYTRMLLQLSGE